MGRSCAVRVLKGCRGGGAGLLPQRHCENVAFPIGFWLPPLQTYPCGRGFPPPCFDSRGRCPNYTVLYCRQAVPPLCRRVPPALPLCRDACHHATTVVAHTVCRTRALAGAGAGGTGHMPY